MIPPRSKTIVEKTLRTSKNAFGMWKHPIGRGSLKTLGYRMEIVDRLPSKCVARFNGLGNPFYFQEPGPGERLLVVECGGGTDLLYGGVLIGQGGFGLGLDLSEALVSEAEETIRDFGMTWLTVRTGSPLDPSFTESDFDRVVFNGSFYLFFRKRELLENCRRALKPGGKIQLADLILEPGAENIGSIYSELWPGGIGSVMNRETLISLLEEAGFWNIRVHPLGYRIHPWIASICIQGERR